MRLPSWKLPVATAPAAVDVLVYCMMSELPAGLDPSAQWYVRDVLPVSVKPDQLAARLDRDGDVSSVGLVVLPSQIEPASGVVMSTTMG